MTKYFTILILLLKSISSIAENKLPKGVYTYGTTDTVEVLTDSTLRFDLYYGCCVNYRMYGYGKYRILGEELIVQTEMNERLKSSYLKIIGLIDTPYIKISLKPNEALSAINPIKISSGARSSIKEFYITRDTILDFNTLKIDSSSNFTLTIWDLGMIDLEFDLKNLCGKSVQIKSVPYQISVNQKIAFKISQGTIGQQIKLMGPFFKNKNQKINFREWIANAYYNPFWRNKFWGKRWRHEPRPKFFSISNL
jgi:hypothetical protein